MKRVNKRSCTWCRTEGHRSDRCKAYKIWVERGGYDPAEASPGPNSVHRSFQGLTRGGWAKYTPPVFTRPEKGSIEESSAQQWPSPGRKIPNVFDPDQVISRVAKFIREGQTMEGAAYLLNAEEVPTLQFGRRWGPNNLREFLHKRGMYVHTTPEGKRIFQRIEDQEIRWVVRNILHGLWKKAVDAGCQTDGQVTAYLNKRGGKVLDGKWEAFQIRYIRKAEGWGYPGAPLSESELSVERGIKRCIDAGNFFTYVSIARHVGVSHLLVGRICRAKRWALADYTESGQYQTWLKRVQKALEKSILFFGSGYVRLTACIRDLGIPSDPRTGKVCWGHSRLRTLCLDHGWDLHRMYRDQWCAWLKRNHSQIHTVPNLLCKLNEEGIVRFATKPLWTEANLNSFLVKGGLTEILDLHGIK